MSTTLALAGAALSLLMAFNATQASAAGCKKGQSSTVFSRFGDLNYYSLLPGSNFESGLTDWTLRGASVVAGNETYFVGGTSHSKSLKIASSGGAVSPAFCVDAERPHFRFFAKGVSGTTGQLNVKLRWKNDSGVVVNSSVATLNLADYTGWKPTPDLQLATRLALKAIDQTRNVQILFEATGSNAVWQIDDVYIDPYRR
jgi:hypothetical protein